MIARLLRSDRHIVDVSAGVGMRHEYSGTDVLLSRFVIGRQFTSWQSYSNLLLEKPLSGNRDEVDLITTAGFFLYIVSVCSARYRDGGAGPGRFLGKG